MFWFSYTQLHGRLTIMDVTATQAHGRRCYTAAWSEDPRVAYTDHTPDAALARLVAHLEGRLAPTGMHVTFLPAPSAAVPA
jgi:hypothetical protein